MQSHIDNTHKFPCSECALPFKNRVILVDYKDFVHKKKENEETTKDPKKNDNTDIEQKKCNVCDVHVTTEEELKKHTEADHFFACNLCQDKFVKKSELATHKLSKHVFTCLFCTFQGETEEIMEEHILEKHAKPDEDNWYNVMIAHSKQLTKKNLESISKRTIALKLKTKSRRKAVKMRRI